MRHPFREVKKAYPADYPLQGVEVGVCFGDNAVDFIKGLGLYNRGHVWLVDSWCTYGEYGGWDQDAWDRNYEKAKAKFVGREDSVTILRLTSEEAVHEIPDELDFVYIDAAHDYENVKKDVQLWWPKVKVGGFLSGDDYDTGLGIKQAVDEFLGAQGRLADLQVSGNRTQWWIRK